MKRQAKKIIGVIIIILLALAALYAFIHAPASSPGDSQPAQNSTGNLIVEMVDVGQGDCFLIVTPDGRAILVDSGEADARSAVVSALNEYSIKQIDLLVATHPHTDHIGGMEYIINNYAIGEVLLPDYDYPTSTNKAMLKAIDQKNVKATPAQPGIQYTFGEVAINVLAPVRTDYENVNDVSVVFKLTYGNTRFLFTGDIEETAEADIIAAGANLSADVLKAAHHGSDTSTTNAFLRAVHPSVALVSCGRNNDYGYPHTYFRRKMENAGITYYRSDLNGNVVLLSDGKTITRKNE